ncbi:hypothetical protein KKA47_05370 [bacterium]|nr:hypothetical protein [bacterium]
MNKKAIALLSGGLDSILAIKVILDQGIEVEALNFFTPFCQCNRKSGGCGHEARKVSTKLGVKLSVVNVSEKFLKVIQNPKHGYGKNINPCLDCRILMFKEAKEYMNQVGASFVITGEVLGQRPMSQHKRALKIVETESDLAGLILRPLSAQLLEETIPEKEGVVNREELLQIHGRSRKAQMSLAKDHGINDYPCPAGGCLLTDREFAKKMRDQMKYKTLTVHDVELLKIGRHFRLSPKAKLIVGRNELENQKLQNYYRDTDVRFEPNKIPGPTALAVGELTAEEQEACAQIVVRYCGKSSDEEVSLNVTTPGGEIKNISAKKISEDNLKKLTI